MARLPLSTDDNLKQKIFDATRAATTLPTMTQVTDRLAKLEASGKALNQTFGCCGFAAAIMWTLDRDKENLAEASNTFKMLCEYAFGEKKAAFPDADYDFSEKIAKAVAAQAGPTKTGQSMSIRLDSVEIDIGRRLAWRLKNPSWTDKPAILDLATCVTLMILFKIHLTYGRTFRINNKRWALDRSPHVADTPAIRGYDAILARAYAYSEKFGAFITARPADRTMALGAPPNFNLRKGDLALPYFGLWALIEFITARLGFAGPVEMIPSYLFPDRCTLRANAAGPEEKWLVPYMRALTSGTTVYPTSATAVDEARKAVWGIWQAMGARFKNKKFGGILGLARHTYGSVPTTPFDEFLDIAHWVYMPWKDGQKADDIKIWTYGEEWKLDDFLRRGNYIPVWGVFLGFEPKPV